MTVIIGNADLARQMLAYSGKGKFMVEDLDLNSLLEEMLREAVRKMAGYIQRGHKHG